MRRFFNNLKNHSNWLNYYFTKHFGNPGAGFVFKSRGGINVHVPKRMFHTYKECFFDETYTKGFSSELLKKLNNPTVIDVGANVGYFSLYMLSKFRGAKVLAFEPMPMNFTLLSRYRKENSKLDFRVINKAVGGKKETLVLNYDAKDEFTTSASVFDTRVQPDRIEVECTTLAETIREHDLDKIDFLKLDCEGSEYGIIYGASRELLDKISMLAIETHVGKSENENTGTLAAYLQQNGFQVKISGDIIWGWK